jgi:hypothetical protein
MGWLPDTPDELFGAIVIIVVLGAVALVMLGRLILWVTGWPIWRQLSVNHSTRAGANYVAQRAEAAPVSRVSRLETETEAEAENASEIHMPALPPGAMVYTPEQIERIKADAKFAGQAEAFGLLLGAGHLAAAVNADQVTAAKRLVFGTSGRAMNAANKVIASVAAQVAPPAPAARLVPVNDGERGHVEL